MSSPTPLAKTSSVQGIAIRVTRLNSDGTAMTGTDSAYTMNRFVSVTFTPVYDGSNTIQQQLANGNFAVTYQTSDVFQRIECTAQIAGPDPEFNEIFIGGKILTDEEDNTVGWAPTAPGQLDVPNGVCLEMWSLAVDGARQAVSLPYYHWILPRVYMHPSDDKTLENDVLSWSTTGWGNDNPSFAQTGVQTGDTGWKWTTDRPFQYARVASAPVGVNGYDQV